MERTLSIEGGNSRSQNVEESIWKRIWTCRLTDYWWWWWYITRHVSPYLSQASSGLSLSVYVKHRPTHTGTDIFLLRFLVFACHLIGMVQNANFSNAFAQ